MLIISDSAVVGEMELWVDVILQAIDDAYCMSHKFADKHNKTLAIRWLTVPNRDFYTVCDLAGLNPVFIQEKVTKTFRKRGII